MIVILCKQVAIHAIGDKANDRVLELAEMVENENGMRDRRFRVNNLNLVGLCNKYSIPECFA